MPQTVELILLVDTIRGEWFVLKIQIQNMLLTEYTYLIQVLVVLWLQQKVLLAFLFVCTFQQVVEDVIVPFSFGLEDDSRLLQKIDFHIGSEQNRISVLYIFRRRDSPRDHSVLPVVDLDELSEPAAVVIRQSDCISECF